MTNDWKQQASTHLKGRSKAPLWRGPEVDGITFSLLSRFLVCRERFRLMVVEGLQPVSRFNHKLEFGNMWHKCEEALAARVPSRRWEIELRTYAEDLCRKYPTSQSQVEHWYNVVSVQFPIYENYWQKTHAASGRPLMQEQVFNVPYVLPSNKTVILKGKWDSVDLDDGIWLQENKTKGDIRPQQIQRQLKFDLQTMLYLIALDVGRRMKEYKLPLADIRGVRYNVIRRPLSGGKGTIVRHKGTKNKPAETEKEFYQRLAQYIRDEPDTYFMRWEVKVTDRDVDRFKTECFTPILEQLCDWWKFISTGSPWRDDSDGDMTYRQSSPHWRHPFGVFNPLDEGGSSDVDGYLEDGSEVGLERCDNLFPELG